MAIQRPSVLKKGDEKKIYGQHPKTEADKARSYEKLRGNNIDIPQAQKAERFERIKYRAENGVVAPRNRGRSTFTVPELPWLKDKE